MVTASRALIKLARKLAARDEVLAMRRRGRLVPVPVKPSGR
jgi:hypothetical protein